MLDNNLKTLKSLDPSTICPKVKEGDPCEYCYVVSARKIGFRAKKEIDRREYKRDILRLRQPTIDKLNRMGGLRIFSFGDYESWMDKYLEMALDDAKEKNLLLKAITKQREFIDKYRGKIFINYSIDDIKPEPEWISNYLGDDVKLRVLIRNRTEAKKWASRADVLTPYHGPKLSDEYQPGNAMTACIGLAPGKTCGKTKRCISCDVRCGRT